MSTILKKKVKRCKILDQKRSQITVKQHLIIHLAKLNKDLKGNKNSIGLKKESFLNTINS